MLYENSVFFTNIHKDKSDEWDGHFTFTTILSDKVCMLMLSAWAVDASDDSTTVNYVDS